MEQRYDELYKGFVLQFTATIYQTGSLTRRVLLQWCSWVILASGKRIF